MSPETYSENMPSGRAETSERQMACGGGQAARRLKPRLKATPQDLPAQVRGESQRCDVSHPLLGFSNVSRLTLLYYASSGSTSSSEEC
jgi:hypothetical protein